MASIPAGNHWTEDELRRLLERAGPQLRAQLRLERRWRRLIDLDDVLQITFTEAFLALPDLRAKDEPAVIGWLANMARNNLRDAVRGFAAQRRPDGKNRVTPDADGASEREFFERLVLATTTPSRNVAAQELKDAIWAAVDNLPGAHATVIRGMLRGGSAAELARELQRSPGAIHMLRARACDHLRAILGGQFGGATESR